MFGNRNLTDFTAGNEVAIQVAGGRISVGILGIIEVGCVTADIVGTGIGMSQGEALEILVHALDFSKAGVIEAPVGKRNLREWRGDIHLRDFLSSVGSQESSGEDLLTQRTVADRIAGGVDHAARIGIIGGQAAGQLETSRLEIVEQHVTVGEEPAEAELCD